MESFTKKLIIIMSVVVFIALLIGFVTGSDLLFFVYGLTISVVIELLMLSSMLFFVLLLAFPIALVWQLIQDKRSLAASKKEIEAELAAIKAMEGKDNTESEPEPVTTSMPVMKVDEDSEPVK